MTAQQHVKVTQASKKLLDLIANMPKPEFKKVKQWKDEVLAQAKKEGYPLNAAGILIRQQLEGYYSERYIRELLPKEAKANTIALVNRGGDRHKKAEKSSASEHKDEPENEDDTEDQDDETEEEIIEAVKEPLPKINYDSYFSVTYNDRKYLITSDKEKLKDYPVDVLHLMIGQLVGALEFEHGNLDTTQKQVELLRAKIKRLEDNSKADQLTIKNVVNENQKLMKMIPKGGMSEKDIKKVGEMVNKALGVTNGEKK